MTKVALLALLAPTVLACAEGSAPRARATTTSASASASASERLQVELAALASASDGVTAISIVHPARNLAVTVNGDRAMPMMSVFKLPLALVTLTAVDDGQRTLADSIPISGPEIRSSVSPIADAWKAGQHAFPLDLLLTRTVQDSDNTGGDKLVTMNGGGAAITARLQKLGLTDLVVAEEEIDIGARLQCAPGQRPAHGWTEAEVRDCRKLTERESAVAAEHEAASSPNHATTNALARLLTKLDHGELLAPQSTAWLTRTLEGATTGAGRLKAGLPPGTKVLHKTGTGSTVGGLTVATNDVGLVQLPDGSRFAIAVLTAGSRKDLTAREALIARAARLAWNELSQ